MPVLYREGNKSCGKFRPHSDDFDKMCGAVSEPSTGSESTRYRCSLRPHLGKHHACGEHWEVVWG